MSAVVGPQYHQDFEEPPRPGISRRRRLLDVLASALGLLCLVPVLAGIALAVKLTSPGPVFFRQRRVGEHGRPFTILKFRTMAAVQPGPRASERAPEVTALNDARITRVGSFLRRTSLDELPQLMNVLAGHMTLVGPRPETRALAARYPESCRWVLEHRPGVTGPTQVRLRDFETIPDGLEDIESWYLGVLVPERVTMDATFLAAPTLRATLRMLMETARHLCF